MENQWFGVYIFYDDLDVALRYLVEPFLSRYGHVMCADTPFFFIRYNQGGPHIRLRMNLKKKADEHIISTALLKESHFFFNEFPKVQDLFLVNGGKLVKTNRIEFVPYEPEYLRYGGSRAMPWAERHFYISSATILNWTKNGGDGLIQALKIHLMLLFSTGFEFGILKNICRQFIAAWLPRLYQKGIAIEKSREYWLESFETAFSQNGKVILSAVRQFWIQLKSNEVSEDVNAFLEINTVVFTSYRYARYENDAFTSILTSMMHMNNNRLGISNMDEAYIGFCVMRSLDFIQNN